MSEQSKAGVYGEPWDAGDVEHHPAGYQIEVCDRDGETLGWMECPEGDETKASRAMACVNACEGLDDPQQLRAQRDELLDVLVEALPYVEMAEHDALYKPGTVKKMVNKMRKAIAHATPEPASK